MKSQERSRTTRHARRLNIPSSDIPPAIFADPASRAVQEMLDRLAPTDTTLLIIGETGTGKEMAARYVHERSHRRSGVFLAVNSGALSDTLAEAELFGHEKGAFTGAVREQRGWFEAAHGGTLLLDEIGDLPLHLQVKLLRVLQEREVTRVGSRTPIPIDVRVIAATNVDLDVAIAEKRFREDLYFRLNVATVLLPPLRDRKEGFPNLVHHFLKLYGDRLGRPNIAIDNEALKKLARYSWPGNIRELENVIHNAVLLTHDEVIGSQHLTLGSSQPSASADANTLEASLQLIFEKQIHAQEDGLFIRTMRTLVQSAFDLVDGNQVRAAEALGISRNTLRTQLSHLGVLPPRRRRATDRAAPVSPRLGTKPQERCIGFQKFGTLSILKARRTLESQLSARGIALRWIEYPAGPQLLDALNAGTVDFGTTGEVPPIFAQANGAPILYVGYEPPAPSGVALVVRRDSPIQTISELRGKRIQLNWASNVHYLIIRGLEADGLSLDDVELVHAAPQEPMCRWAGEEIQCWALWDPLLTMALRSNEVRILFDGTGLVSNHHFHIASQEFARDDPETVTTILQELRIVGQQAVGNPAEAARALSLSLGIDVPALEIAFARLSYGAKPLDRDVIWEQQKIADRFYALGLIPRAISVREAVIPMP